MLLAVSVLLVLVGIEVALTLFYPTEYLKVPDRTSDSFFKTVVHQRSAVPGLSFELAPNRRKKFKGIWVRTNSLGMRDAEPLPIESDAVSRIVVLGDSFTFGLGVDGDSTYPTVLEQRLNDGAREKRFEVLNLGVSGYNTQDEAAVLEHKGLPWRPDLVVLSYALNDPETEPVQPLNHHFHEPAVWQRSNLARLAAKGLRDLKVALWGAGDYYLYLHAEDQKRWLGVLAALENIRELTESQQIPVLVVIFPRNPEGPWSAYPYAEIHEQIARASREQGFAVIDLLDRFTEYRPKATRIRRGDPHPSPWGHKVAAAAIYEWIASDLPNAELSTPQVAPSL